mmetsp:Transcript_10333/g.20730  ORF Transcript_10333/g.20730 Transcript_10333/m.20730 type:complete len:92 (+) Transcript_10333:1889-2164(+)
MSIKWKEKHLGGVGPFLQEQFQKLNFFFWKSFYYLMAFYLTWPPYLVLQFRLSNKKAYTNYGLFLIAGILVPLQGFWNFLAHLRIKRIVDY